MFVCSRLHAQFMCMETKYLASSHWSTSDKKIASTVANQKRQRKRTSDNVSRWAAVKNNTLLAALAMGFLAGYVLQRKE